MKLSPQQRRHLRNMLGRPICYRGENGRIIEFLEHEEALVVQLDSAVRSLQESQYGEPGRQVNPTRLLPIFDPEQPGQLNQELTALDITL